MYHFIEEISDKDKRSELIKEQNKITFNDFFNKRLGAFMDFYQKAKQKACLKIITPNQSIFALAGPSHEKTNNSILDVAFNGDFQRKEGEKIIKDAENNMKLGNIYIKIYDSDVKIEKQSFLKKIFSRDWCDILIYVPKVFNQYQIDELRKTIEDIKNNSNFKTMDIYLRHYINFENDDKVDYESDKVYNFLGENIGDANKYIQDVETNPNETIIVDTCRNKNNSREDFLDSLLHSSIQNNKISEQSNNTQISHEKGDIFK